MANAKKCDACERFYTPYGDEYEVYIDSKHQGKKVEIRIALAPLMWNSPTDLCRGCLHTTLTKIVDSMEKKLT